MHEVSVPTKGPSGSILPRVLLLIFALVVGLGLCEALLRLVTREPAELSLLRGSDFQEIYLEPDPQLGVVRRPNLDLYFRFEERPSGFIHFQTNNLGLRRIEPTGPPSGAVQRVLVLGDSQIDGSVDNQENVCSLLEARLNAAGRRFEVLNAATGSYSPYQSFLWYRSRGVALSPRLVLFTVFLGNDLAELVAPGRPRLKAESGGFQEVPGTDDFARRMQTRNSPSAWTAAKFFLLQNSVLFGRMASLAGGSAVQAPGPMGAAYRNCIGCTGQSLGQIYWFKHHPGDLTASLESLRELLGRLKDLTGQNRCRLAVLVLPTRLEVEPEQDGERTQRTAAILGLSNDDLQLDRRLETDTVRIARELGIATVDLGPLMAEHHRETGESLYYQTDWHLNAAGHRFLAETLYEDVLHWGTDSVPALRQ